MPNAEDSDPSAGLKENLSEGSSVFGENVQVTSATTASAEAPEGALFEEFTILHVIQVNL